MKSYRYFGSHPEDIGGGRMLEPGESAQLSAEQERSAPVQRLLEEGKLIAQESPEPGIKKEVKTSDGETRS